MSLKVALIGAGRRAQGSHLKVLNEFRKDRIEFTAVCDINADTVSAVAALYKVNGYTDIRNMLDKEQIDVCIVTVPPDAHHSVSCYLSNRGVHHLVETPIASSVSLANFAIETAVRNNVIFEVSENFPFMPVEQMTMTVIRSGAVGKIGRVYRLFSTSGAHGISVINDRAGGVPIKVYSLDHSFPVETYVDGMKRTYHREGLEFAAIRYDNGAMGILMCGNKNGALGRNKLVGFEAAGSRGVVVTNGNQGSLGGEEVRVVPDENLMTGGRALSAFYEREYRDIQGESVIQRMWVDIPGSGTLEWSNPYRRYAIPEHLVSVAYLHDSIYNAIERQSPLLYTARRATTDMEILLAMRYSAQRDGAGVELPLEVSPDEEERVRSHFLRTYNKDPYDIEGLLDVSFPRL